MKGAWIILFAALPLLCRAQEQTMTLDEMAQTARQWAQEHLDEDALRVLEGADQQKVKEVLAEIQKHFRGEYVLNLAGLKETAKGLLPILESHDETIPYARWLKARLDYLDFADELRLIIPPPATEPGQPTRPTPNPGPGKQRELWIRKLSKSAWPDNAKPYVSKLKPIFIEEKVPGELVWIAEVESSFDPRAQSPAGAAGLFQLMPATAKQQGLRTWPFDERLKPEPSARAAAKYLNALHRRFKDWPLTLAAYNAGEGTVQHLLKRRNGHSFDDIATHLPAETQMYVPRIEATVFEREGVKLSELK